MKRILIVALVFVLIIGGAILAFWEEIQIAHVDYVSRKTFSEVGKVDRVEIHLIMGDEATEPIGEFLLGPYDSNAKVYKIEDIQGAELGTFLEIWRSQRVDHMRQAMCHYAAYGFKFYDGEDLVRETSICWACSNYYFKYADGYSWGGFVADSPEGKSLLTFCDELIPYDRTFENEMKRRQEEYDKKRSVRNQLSEPG